ncbi:IS66 family transposase [Desulfosarcina ovata]|uniref:IS66 family transposase n=1 Tax=Desulfosarcina ovata TaxID=83564 RepID=UPI0012D2F0B8|nr:IS66 family transposase [Desulfosarcina ovata]
MSLEPNKLPDDAESLRQIISTQQHEIDHLKEMVRLLQNEIFGRRSESLSSIHPNQLPLFGSDTPVEPIQEDEKIVVPEHTRKKRGRKPLPEDLPRVDVVHDLPEEEKRCACGAELSRIGEEVCEKLDYIPAKVRVIRHIRPKYACKHCEGVEDDGPTVKIAPPPVQLIPKSNATEGLLAHIAVSKFADALPLYRQQKIFDRLGVELSRSTLANWMIQAAARCGPLIDLMAQEIRGGPMINIDESPLQVLNEPGRSNTAKSYMWVFYGGPLDAPVVLYRYHPTRSGEIALKIVDGYRGYIQSDGYIGYDHLSEKPDITLLGCMVHARRKFMAVVKVRKKKRGNKAATKGLADEALVFFKELYHIEKYARQNELTIEQTKDLRQEKSKPILDRFKAWLDTYHSQVPPKSLIGKAIQYTLNQWERLVVYIEAGFLKPDNNVAENAIRPFVLGRKNWLFAGGPNGADASATFFSLIETAKANCLEPYAYLRYLFENIPLAQNESDFLALLPNRIDKAMLSASAKGVVD